MTTERLGLNYRGLGWSDGYPITRVAMPDGSEAEAVAALGYLWNGSIWVPATSPTTVFSGKTIVAVAGTQVVLASTQAVVSVVVKALAANTGTIYVGNSTVSSADGFALAAREAVALDIANLATVWIDCSVNGEGVTYLAVG